MPEQLDFRLNYSREDQEWKFTFGSPDKGRLTASLSHAQLLKIHEYMELCIHSYNEARERDGKDTSEDNKDAGD